MAWKSRTLLLMGPQVIFLLEFGIFHKKNMALTLRFKLVFPPLLKHSFIFIYIYLDKICTSLEENTYTI